MSRSLAAQAPASSDPARLAELANACVGWIGRGAANLAACDRISVVVDGEIYNREGLSDGGSAAEIVRQLYLRHGFADCLAKINGDFAIALYDKQVDRLWLARDRIGIRPLYHARTSDGFGFASQPLGVLAMPGVAWDVDQSYVARFAGAHYRYFDNYIHGSPFAAVSQIPAGHCLRVDRDGGSALFRYWTLTDLPDWEADEERLAETYRDLLLDAVTIRHRRADRPAFTLSGGMDSSSVLASAVRTSGHRQTAVSTVYDDKTYDESDDIRTILDDVADDWIQVPVEQPDVFDLVGQMVAIHNEPVATATWLSHFILCRDLSGRGFTELFGGLGGDELNAGEYEYFPYHFADLQRQQKDRQLDREIDRWIDYHDHPIFQKSREFALAEIARLTDPSRPGACTVDQRRLGRYLSMVEPDYFDLQGFRPETDHPFYTCLENRTYQDIFRETAPCCLRAEDRHGAHFNLANRLPFFDYRLVEFMFRVPGTLKIRDGVTKHLLRKATRGVLPEATRGRIKKTGWNAPAHVWFSGSSRSGLRDLITSKEFRERGIYDVDRVIALEQEHENIVTGDLQVDNHMMFFWQLVNLHTWLDWVDATRGGMPATDTGEAGATRTSPNWEHHDDV